MQNDSTGPKNPSPEMGRPTSISHSVTSAYGSENTLEPFAIDAQNSIILVAATVSNIMFFLAGPPGWIVGIAVLAGILGATIPLFFSEQTAQETWNPLSKYAAAMMDSKITEVMISIATSKTKQLHASIQVTEENLRAWLDSNKKSGRDLLRSGIFDLLNDYIPEMENLIQGTYRGTLLPQYTQAALHFVTTLKSIYPYADELNLNARSVTSGKELIVAKLRAAIAKFVDEAIKSYRYGLKQIIVRSQTTEVNTPTWVEYNRYRNAMTQTALDIVVTFPYFDLGIYPTTPAAKWLTRRLYTLLDTAPEYSSPNLNPKNIAEFDAFVLTCSPVTFLEEIEQNFISVIVDSDWAVDGLINVQCTVRSIDGDAYIHKLERSGATSEYTKSEKMPVKSREIYTLHGWYWNGRARWDPWSDMARTVNLLTYNFIDQAGNTDAPEFRFNAHDRVDGSTQFAMGFPVAISPLDPDKIKNPSLFKERLAEIRIPSDKRPHYSYLFDWNSRSLSKDMLPSHHHDPSSGIKYVEQYHAVKAASSIFNQRLEIISGPGFTGGDLVRVGASKMLGFYMKRDPQRWFSGNYRARIWYVIAPETDDSIGVELSIFSPDAVGSNLTGTVPYATPPSNTNNLTFANLKCFDFSPGFLGLFPIMTTILLIFRNTSRANSIIVDRIELIFDSAASY